MVSVQPPRSNCRYVLFSIQLVLAMILLLSTTGCVLPRSSAKAPMAFSVQEEDALKFMPVNDQSAIYIYRSRRSSPYLWSPILIDDKFITRLVGQSFCLVLLPPGEHEINSRAGNEFRLKIDAKAGEVIFVRQSTYFGLRHANAKLSVVSEEVGKAELPKCHLLSQNIEVPNIIEETPIFSRR